MNASELKAVAGIAMLYIFRMLGLFMVLPVLALHADEFTGTTPVLIGLALGMYGLSQAVLQIPFGLLSDRIGRKPVILAGLVIFIAGSVVAANATSIYGVISGRCLQGCGAIASTMMALLSDLTRIEQRTKSMAVLGISIGMSFGVALVLGPYVAGNYGLSGIFWITALFGMVGILLVISVIPTPTTQSINRDAELVTTQITGVLLNRELLRIDFGIFMLHFHLMASFVAFPLLLRSSGEVSDQQHWLVYLSVLIFSFLLISPLMKKSDDSQWTKRVILIALMLFIAAYFVVSQPEPLFWRTWCGMLIFFMAFNLLEITYPSLLSKIAPAGARGTAMGTYSTAQFLGAFCGGTVGGLLLQLWDMTVLFYVNIAVILVWLISIIPMMNPPDVSSRTIHLAELHNLTANRLREALSSVAGVEEVVIIEDDRVAYLKVDNDRFDDDSIDQLRNFAQQTGVDQAG